LLLTGSLYWGGTGGLKCPKENLVRNQAFGLETAPLSPPKTQKRNPQRQGLGKFCSFMDLELALGQDLEKKLPGVSQGWAALHTGILCSPPLPSSSQLGGLAHSTLLFSPHLLNLLTYSSLVLPPSGTLIFWALRNGLP
jgi:hypothetical protein